MLIETDPRTKQPETGEKRSAKLHHWFCSADVFLGVSPDTKYLNTLKFE